MDPLESINPIDGRYRQQLEELSKYFSEHALMIERVRVEVAYLRKFIEEVEEEKLSELPINWRERIAIIPAELSLEEARKIKEIEAEIGHDVAAVTRYIREKLRNMGLEILAPYVHIGLTSEDVNNLAYSRLLSRFNREALLPSLVRLLERIAELALEHVDTVMLGRTHGVPAIPTTFGRFLANYAYRLAKIADQIYDFKFPGKLGGAVGDHSALKFAYPDIDWVKFSREFVESLGLEYVPSATQILPHEGISRYLMNISLLDSILSNLCRDLWMMSALGLLVFTIKKGEVHSSTMPHKSNPIFLENAEGSFDLASATASYIAKRLLSSRLHRDLSDSVIKRFYGLPSSLTILGVANLNRALERMIVNREEMLSEVESHPESLAEAYQVYLRRAGIENAYEIIQDSLREGWNEVLRTMRNFLPEESYEEVASIKPSRYIGESEKVTLLLLDEVEKIYKKITDYLAGARS
ncbi:MAG: lyase family protein [Nitrososphaeria archaeon]|nr:lyase family protein [Nitrososphaeria archaeon]